MQREKYKSTNPAYQLQVFSLAAVAAEAFADGSSLHSERIRSVDCHKCYSDCAMLPANRPILYRHLRHMTVVCYVTFSQASDIHSTKEIHICKYECRYLYTDIIFTSIDAMLIYLPCLLLSFHRQKSPWNPHREKDSSQYWHYQIKFFASGERG